MGPLETPRPLADERAALEASLASMRAEMAALIAASRSSNADDEHDPEGPTIAYERSQLSSMIHRAEAHRAEVEAAAQRVAGGTYGRCEVCGRPIEPSRLEARPSARSCREHAD